MILECSRCSTAQPSVAVLVRRLLYAKVAEVMATLPPQLPLPVVEMAMVVSLIIVTLTNSQLSEHVKVVEIPPRMSKPNILF